MNKPFRHLSLMIFIILFSLQGTGCALFRKVVLNYAEAKLPKSQVIYDIQYWSSPEADPVKNRLDLFLPNGKNWPTLIFVHGGEWISGDKSLKVMGADIYRNIGRFFASRGIGVAIINYRLMPGIDWKSQIMDVARAVDWVHQHIKEYQGNPKAIFIAGHSSGAQLAVRVALDGSRLQALGLSPNVFCGVIPVSGAGYDLTDEETYELAKKEDIFEKLFHTGSIPESLRHALSPIRFVNSKAPPFLILYAQDEEKQLQHESIRLHEKLIEAGAKSQLIVIPQEDHKTVILSLSNPQKIPTAAILVFINTISCS
jgi:acetyl esterase/lipase